MESNDEEMIESDHREPKRENAFKLLPLVRSKEKLKTKPTLYGICNNKGMVTNCNDKNIMNTQKLVFL